MKPLVIAAFTALALSTPVLAQPPAAPQETAAVSFIPIGVSDEEVRSMRAVASQVAQITRQHQPVIAAAPDDVQRGEQQRALYARLDTLVRTQGLTVERYNQIATLAGQNPDLARAIGPSR